jgi:hypothetical protein
MAGVSVGVLIEVWRRYAGRELLSWVNMSCQSAFLALNQKLEPETVDVIRLTSPELLSKSSPTRGGDESIC